MFTTKCFIDSPELIVCGMIVVVSGDEVGVRHNKLENGSVIKGVRVSDFGELPERQRSKVYAEVLRSYEDLQPRIDRLEEAKNIILRYIMHP